MSALIKVCFLTLLLAARSLPCSCGPRLFAPACEVFHETAAVFTCTVLDHNDDGSGKFTQSTLYLVRVDERFSGLDARQKEVFIDPGSFTSCYAQYRSGQQYLFFAGQRGNFAAVTVTRPQRPGKPLPKRWAGKQDVRVYSANVCSGSKPTSAVQHVAPDLAWLRSQSRGGAKSRVYGYTVQNLQASISVPASPMTHFILGSAKVTLSNEELRLETTSRSTGEYSFEGIPPGAYVITAENGVAP